MAPLSALPDGKIKLARKLLAMVGAWQITERQWVQLELAGDNLQEQLKATDHCTEFRQLASSTFSSDPEAPGIIIRSLQDKIQVCLVKNEASLNALIAELESQQKRFYQFRQEVEKSLLGLRDLYNYLLTYIDRNNGHATERV